MATAEDVLDIARGELGYYAPGDPEAGSKYGRWMADLTGEDWLRGPSTSIWWCCMFVSWCLAQAGQECVGFPSYNTDSTLSQGPSLVYREDVRPGDIIIWDWDGNGATDHIGFVEGHEPGSLGTLTTIEGNYSNSVARVDRSDCWGLVSACIRPPYGTGTVVTPSEALPIDTVARQVINGDWGDGDERKSRLEAAGYSYEEVQGRVNTLLAGGSDGYVGTLDEVAYQVLNGDWGNGSERERRLAEAGYDYEAVQRRVNELCAPVEVDLDAVAQEVVNGDWGNGSERRERLEAAGYNYDAVQARVNELLG